MLALIYRQAYDRPSGDSFGLLHWESTIYKKVPINRKVAVNKKVLGN